MVNVRLDILMLSRTRVLILRRASLNFNSSNFTWLNSYSRHFWLALYCTRPRQCRCNLRHRLVTIIVTGDPRHSQLHRLHWQPTCHIIVRQARCEGEIHTRTNGMRDPTITLAVEGNVNQIDLHSTSNTTYTLESNYRWYADHTAWISATCLTST